MRLPGKKFWNKAIRRGHPDGGEYDDDEPDILPWELPFESGKPALSTDSASDSSMVTAPGVAIFNGVPRRTFSDHSRTANRVVRRRLVHGPVFAIALESAVHATHLVEFDEEVDDMPDELYHWRHCPSVVVRCLQYLSRDDRLQEEGLFRVPGSNQVVQDLRRDFDDAGDVHLAARRKLQTADVASLLKLYLRELPSPIVSDTQAADLLGRFELDEKQLSLALSGAGRKPRAYKNLRVGLSLLKPEQFFLLRALARHLHAVLKHASSNLMDIGNLSIVFTATTNLNLAAPLIAALVEKESIWRDLACCHLPAPANLARSPDSSLSSSPVPAMSPTEIDNSKSGRHRSFLGKSRSPEPASLIVPRVTSPPVDSTATVQADDLWGGITTADQTPQSRSRSASLTLALDSAGPDDGARSGLSSPSIRSAILSFKAIKMTEAR